MRTTAARHSTLARDAAPLDADLRAAPGHVIAHRRVRHPGRVVLLDQPGMSGPGEAVSTIRGPCAGRPTAPAEARLLATANAWAAVALTHAVLALAAATAVGGSGADSRAWADAAGVRLRIRPW
jgi:hypothetical protein